MKRHPKKDALTFSFTFYLVLLSISHIFGWIPGQSFLTTHGAEVVFPSLVVGRGICYFSRLNVLRYFPGIHSVNLKRLSPVL